MRTVIECLIIVAMVEALYFNLTAIPKQDYQHNNPYVYSWVRK
jgi:hypothetical protein